MNFEINTKEEKENNNKIIILLCIIFGSIFIITLIISIVVCAIFKNKNKNLTEQVQAISFSRGIDEDSLNKSNRKILKEEDDYESTFI